MKRHIVLLLVVGLVAGALAPAQAAKKKKKKPKPVAVDVTYTIVPAGDGVCGLSTDAELADDTSCGDPFAGSTTGSALGSGEPILVSALDGLPLTLDAAKPIQGTLNIGSYTLAALADNGAGVPLGVGEGEWQIGLTGTSGGEDVTIGEVTSDSYLVTPGTGDYEVTFEITPGEELAGTVFDSLTLSLEQIGSATVHGAIRADGTSTLTLGAFVRR